MSQKEMFENIIGYDDIKPTLKIIVDMLNNEKKYKKIGCSKSHGLLLYGPPGTGKTSIAKEILMLVERNPITIRKTKSDGSFIDHLTDLFELAKKEQPSIILLDDLDKFAETDDDSTNEEEFVAVQSLIDDIKDEDIFVIATANDIDKLPESLKRKGRFDYRINVDKPTEEDCVKIFEHYLENKNIDKDVDVKKLCNILNSSTCAELEEVTNQAGIYAAFNNKEKIGMEELIKAALELEYETCINDIYKEDEYALDDAYHEAGHALISNLLEPKSVSFVSTIKNSSTQRGVTNLHKHENYSMDIGLKLNKVKILLAGKAAIEVASNKCDIGANSDIERAYNILLSLVEDSCLLDFNSIIVYQSSDKTKDSRDKNVQKIMTEYYNEVKCMLIANRHTLDELAYALKKKKMLFQDEIDSIIFKKRNI